MAEIVVMPKMNLIMEEGLLGQWYKSVGDTVGLDEPLCSVENEKETADVQSMSSGVLLKIWGVEGERYPVATPIALLGVPGEDITGIVERVEKQLADPGSEVPATPVEQPEVLPEKAPPANIRMLPKLRKLIRDKGINLDALIDFCGKTKITEQDILDYESAQKSAPAVSAGGRRERMSGMRRAIAGNMSESCERTARLTNVTEVDMTDCIKKLGEIKKTGQKVSVTAFIVKACALALREHEIVNASLEVDEIVFHDEINVGCAVDVPNGLVVPVVREADKKDVGAISDEIAGFMERGRRSALTSAETAGGTFTVSNVGMLGVEIFTPIINYPQAAIMGVGAIARLPRYLEVDSEILVPRHILKLSLTYDHRIVDGAPAARFSLKVRELLENPAELLR